MNIKSNQLKQNRTASEQLKIVYESLGIWEYVDQCFERSPNEFLAEISSIVDVTFANAQYRIGWKNITQGLKFLNHIIDRQNQTES